MALPAEMQSGAPGAEVIHGHPWSSMVIQTKTHPEKYGCHWLPSGTLWYPLVICYRLLLKMAIETVDLPIKMLIFHSYVSLPEGKPLH